MKKSLIVIVIGFLISVLISCFPTEHYKITDIKFYAVELDNPEEENDKDKYFIEISDTIKDRLYFEIFVETENYYTAQNNGSLINSVYATSREKVLDNYILFDSLELSFDADIYFEDDTISKNTNIWNNSLIQDYKWQYEYEGIKFYYFNIGFVDSFYQKIIVPNNDYTIKLNCKTNDGLEFYKQLTIYIKL